MKKMLALGCLFLLLSVSYASEKCYQDADCEDDETCYMPQRRGSPNGVCRAINRDNEGSSYDQKLDEAERKAQNAIINESPKGAINVQTGEYYPPAAGGIINPRTGDFYPDVGGGYINPRTGEFMPKQ